jgi:thiopeptide-type bacteriocin biosynthesis protein
MLGRFCQGDADLESRVRSHLVDEEACSPDVIFAEIVHLPEGRLGNILCRPVLRKYEIPFLGIGGAPPEDQIPIEDLYVSVVGDRVVLTSRRLGKEVLPRLSTAHSFRRGQPIYRFLGALQGQGYSDAISWHWGALGYLDFLPRVVFGRTVLSRATWRLSGNDLSDLSRGTSADTFRAVQHLRRRRLLPRFALLVDGDNELPIDFDNVLSVDVFVHLVAGRDRAILSEMFLATDQLVLAGPEGRFVQELLVPFTRRGPEPQVGKHSKAVHVDELTLRSPRLYVPGSDWLYVKLYVGSSTGDRILRHVVAAATSAAMEAGWTDRWFFIRYADPDSHLRVRFHGDPRKLRTELQPLLSELCAPVLANRAVWRMQYDTYQPEVARYGGAQALALCEELFWIDSETVVKLLQCLPEDGGSSMRWRIALLSMDSMLSDSGFDLVEKHALAQHSRDELAPEFGATSSGNRRYLDHKYRLERNALDETFAASSASAGALGTAMAIMSQRTKRYAPVAHSIRNVLTTVAWPSITRSCLHMHVNRLMRSAQRAHEFVLFDFLGRRYRSCLAQRSRHGRAHSAGTPDV